MDRQQSEFKDFFDRIKGTEKDRIELGEILKWLKDWGEYEGANESYFKKEQAADRLYQPMAFTIKDDRSYDDFGLRWYCYRANQNVVILFNGARKTSNKAQDCPNVKSYFLEAIELSKALDEAFGIGLIRVVDTFIIEPDITIKTK